jgi:hypothetical protein
MRRDDSPLVASLAVNPSKHDVELGELNHPDMIVK